MSRYIGFFHSIAHHPAVLARMTVICVLNICPKEYLQAIFSFGVFPFYPPSSAPAASDGLLMNHATSIRFYLVFRYMQYNTLYFACQELPGLIFRYQMINFVYVSAQLIRQHPAGQDQIHILQPCRNQADKLLHLNQTVIHNAKHLI